MDEQRPGRPLTVTWDYCPLAQGRRGTVFISAELLRRVPSKAEFQSQLRQAFSAIGEAAVADWEQVHGQDQAAG